MEETVQTPHKRFPWARVTALTITAALITGGVVAYQQRHTINNWWLAKDYQANERVQNIVSHLELTPAAQLLFYSTHPQVTSGATFRSGCSGVSHSESGHVVGCYTHSHRIFLFDVTDERIGGIVEVTAAHEMLHAAWRQLDDKQRLTELLLDHYEKHATDELVEHMQVYAELPQHEFVNE